MRRIVTSKASGAMLSCKDDIEVLLNSIKDVEKEFDDDFQKSLMRYSSLIKIHKALKEIKLLANTINSLMQDDSKSKELERLSKVLREKIMEVKILLMSDMQKSVFSAAEAMAQAGTSMTILTDINKLEKAF